VAWVARVGEGTVAAVAWFGHRRTAGRRAGGGEREVPGGKLPLGFRWRGCSAFHAWWGPPPGVPVVALRATLEILEPPRSPQLYFWALQASFATDNRRHGGAHAGLQWYPAKAPGGTALNWGGYADPPAGGELAGSGPLSPRLAPLPGEVNTFGYPWRPEVPYTFEIRWTPDGWLASVTDGSTGVCDVIRTLAAPGERLTDPVVWAEVFAPCEAPRTAVRWSGFSAVGADGSLHRPEWARLTFSETGDCPNSDIAVDEVGVVLATGVHRRRRTADVVRLPGG
jgi:hypothetical protein